MADYEYTARTLSNLASIPVRIYRDGKFAGVYHTCKFKPDLAIVEEPNIFKNTSSVSYYISPDFLFYGLFRAKNAPICMVLGPVAQFPADHQTATRILLSMGESPSRAEELQHYLESIPCYPLRNFLQILSSFAFLFNGEKLSIGDILQEELDQPMPQLPIRETSDHAAHHNTLQLEEALLSCVEHGRVEELESLFRMPAEGRVGTIAQDALRQQKNLLIVSTTLVSRAAIRGGLDPETALTLSDIYIQKGELLSSYDDIILLSGQMARDYTRRVADLRCGEGNRKLIRSARQYILSHINEKISTEDLAAALGRSRTYLCTCFREETGMSINQYISALKVDEAKRLLKVTNKSLAAIADHLGYSSQSYFQNVFKKSEGITPQEYRTGNK